MLKELGPQLIDLKPGEVILLHGTSRHGVIPFSMPKNGDHPRWQAKYNDGHTFI